MRSRNVIACLLAATLFRTSLPARTIPVVCGTERGNIREELFLHKRSLATRQKLGLKAASGPPGKDIGNIAVLYDAGGVVSRRNPFNLASKGITFTPASGFTRYHFETTDAVYDEDAATGGAGLTGLGDDDTRRLELPFPFPFYGKTWSELWVNSDGNITFGESDTQPVTKSIGLLSGGPPRIAPYFVDLDPSRTTNGVRVYSDATKFIVTWLEVPEFGITGRTNTIQLRLYPNGRIETAYVSANPTNAVVGIAPGNASGVTELVSFLQGSTTEFTAAVAERFTSSESLDTVLLAQRFYETHDDAYDYLAVYNNMGISSRAFSVATELTVRSTYRAGFGDTVVDAGRQYGSANRLQAMLNMGPLSNYPSDPFATVALRGATGDTPLSILAHEVGHLFLALASIRDESDPEARPMLGSALAHWSFNFNTDASFLEGNRIQDNGESATPRFTTTGTVERYSELDQYLMGLRAPSEVPPSFLVRRSGRSDSALPQKGISFNGDRQNITVEEVINAEGRRSPDHTIAQRRFRLAVILVVREGTEPAPAELAQLEQLRSEFEGYYARATEERAAIETSLKNNLQLSLWPAAGMLSGSTIRASVSLDRALDKDLTVLLKTRNGAASMPPSVIIPAGARQAAFPIEGIREGIEEIAAEPSDPTYITDYARLQVNPTAASLKLDLIAGDRQPATPGAALPQTIDIRATDINLIPYPGLTLRLTANSGTLDPADSVITGPDGIARIRWTPGTSDTYELRASIDGSDSALTVTALGKPAFQSTGVLNAASYQPGISPGSLAVIFGANLAAGRTATARTLPWPEQLSGVRVAINGTPALLYYASDGQINFFVPRALSGPTARVMVTSTIGSSSTISVPLLPLSPGLFFNNGTGEAAALIAGTGQLTSQRPATRGDYLEIYATGLGGVQPSTTFPGFEETTVRPRVFLDNSEASVLFSGTTATPGLYQINARIPGDAPTGRIKLKLQSGTGISNEADITIR